VIDQSLRLAQEYVEHRLLFSGIVDDNEIPGLRVGPGRPPPAGFGDLEEFVAADGLAFFEFSDAAAAADQPNDVVIAKLRGGTGWHLYLATVWMLGEDASRAMDRQASSHPRGQIDAPEPFLTDCKSGSPAPFMARYDMAHARIGPIPKTSGEDPVTIVEQGSGPAPQAAADLIKETTTQTFVKDVIEESKQQPVLIDFWAPWCGPCRQLTPILEKAVRAAKGKVKLVKMNIDEHPAIPGQMGIQSIPAVIAFVNGQPADGFMGAVPESQVNAFIDKLTKGMPGAGEPNLAEVLGEAEAVLAEGDAATAAQIYAEVLAADATNIAALAGLAKCYVTTGAIEQAKQTLSMVPESKRGDAAVKAVQASLDLAEQAKAVGPVTELEQKVAVNPLDHQARFDLATALNASGKRAEATQQLLEIVKRDRKWNEDGARKQLVQFFEAWGPTDEATVEGRKRLSTILFS
jgi:putative thioredoxin